MDAIDLIRMCFDGSGRLAGQASAPAAPREAGLAAALRERARLTADVIVSEPTSARGSSGFINERALLEMVGMLHTRVRATLAQGRSGCSPALTARCCSERCLCLRTSSEGLAWSSSTATKMPRPWKPPRPARQLWGHTLIERTVSQFSEY
jgi:hypothetical protein